MIYCLELTTHVPNQMLKYFNIERRGGEGGKGRGIWASSSDLNIWNFDTLKNKLNICIDLVTHPCVSNKIQICVGEISYKPRSEPVINCWLTLDSIFIFLIFLKKYIYISWFYLDLIPVPHINRIKFQKSDLVSSSLGFLGVKFKVYVYLGLDGISFEVGEKSEHAKRII
jgi:hypothetical protein